MNEAAASFRAALERDPNDAVAHSNLAVVLCLQGAYADALRHAERAIALQPRLVTAYVNGAVIAGSFRGYDAALPWIEAALGIEPENVAALLLSATTLSKLDRVEEALASVERALVVQPQNGEAHEILAVTLQAAGRYDDALAAFERAAALSTAGTIGVRKAMLLLELGRAADALIEIDRVIVREPELAVAWFARGLACEFRLDRAEIGTIERILDSSTRLTFNDRVQLRFTLGRAYIEAGEIAPGFSHLEAASTMKRESIDYDVAADERFMASLIERFTPEAHASLRGRGDESEVPVFVVGMPRSGTTLIEQIVAAHPLAFGGGELPYLGRLAETMTTLDADRVGRLGRDYVARIRALAPGAARIVDKMPLNFLHLGLISAALPRARIVHVRRDPVDTCVSCYLTLFERQLGFSYDLEELGRFYRSYQRLIEHWRTLLPPDRFIDVDYEAVVADLDREARRLIEFCGLPWDDRCLRFYEAERPVATASMNQVRRPIYAHSVGRARALLPYLAPLVNVFEAGR
jgi:tetratricopeptide (TPR) repeat protein